MSVGFEGRGAETFIHLGAPWRREGLPVSGEERQKQYAEFRDLLAQEMTSAQLAEAEQRASAWLAGFEKRNKT